MSHSNYSVSTYSNAFEKHLERQENERHKRYADHIQKEMKNKEYSNQNETKKDTLRHKLLSNQQSDNTDGASLILTGEPRLKVHKKRQQIRDRLTANTVRVNQKEQKIRFYPVGNQSSLEFKPHDNSRYKTDSEYVSFKDFCENKSKTEYTI
jgi:hypothetical protein